MANPAAGWYPAPDASDLLRYWDGEMWTEQARPDPDGRGGPATGYAGHPSVYVQRSEIVQNTLQEGETLHTGFHGTGLGPRKMMAATSSRVLFFDPEGVRRRYEVQECAYDEIESIRYSDYTGVNLHVRGSRWRIGSSSEAGQEFIAYVRSRLPQSAPPALSELRPPQSGTPDGDEPERDLIEQLKELGELHTQGLLTADEFSAAKAKLLGG